MEQLKHECGVALIRFRKPLEYYRNKYGTYAWGLSKLYLMMEKQHNRGQEAAGIGVVKLAAPPGSEYVFRERALGAGAISEIFDSIRPKLEACELPDMTPVQADMYAPFIGQIYMGHLRYSTTGKSGIEYVHPFLRRNNWPSRNLLLCGNFNMTNVEQIFDSIVARGQHPRIYSDTIMLLEQLGYALDTENQRLYRKYRYAMPEPALTHTIEKRLDLGNVLRDSSPLWDGGYVICGATGSGDVFVLRDPHGIRPAFYYIDDEIIAVASERPVLQTVFNVPRKSVVELRPGSALVVEPDASWRIEEILKEDKNARCSFERIYFSRGSDADIYQERKALGRNLVPKIFNAIDRDLTNAVFSFIPNTAEVAFIGMCEGLESLLSSQKADEIAAMAGSGKLSVSDIKSILSQKLRIEKVAIKDIKLRTFISEGSTREDLAAHVYDVTYGCVRNGVDSLVVIDDSIVRGTTLRRSILRILDRLHPKKIVVVSSAPQVRYPDCYGIDMSRMSEFIAFRAAVELLHERGLDSVLDETYDKCKASLQPDGDGSEINHVKMIYKNFEPEEIAAKIAEMLTPVDVEADVEIIFQSLEGLHEAVPGCPGDWYFSGDYPTAGGMRFVNRAFVNYYEGNADKR
ncbi:MAG: amidophosphoribosyltransferase [Bacteroides sp.]|nr:amidophosphoribosyltransferase [Bacteroides sp.]